MTDKIIKIDMGKEFKVCPLCGYKDGFHSMLKTEKDVMKWLFICPSCSAVFDVGQPVKQNHT